VCPFLGPRARSPLHDRNHRPVHDHTPAPEARRHLLPRGNRPRPAQSADQGPGPRRSRVLHPLLAGPRVVADRLGDQEPVRPLHHQRPVVLRPALHGQPEGAVHLPGRHLPQVALEHALLRSRRHRRHDPGLRRLRLRPGDVPVPRPGRTDGLHHRVLPRPARAAHHPVLPPLHGPADGRHPVGDHRAEPVQRLLRLPRQGVRGGSHPARTPGSGPHRRRGGVPHLLHGRRPPHVHGRGDDLPARLRRLLELVLRTPGVPAYAGEVDRDGRPLLLAEGQGRHIRRPDRHGGRGLAAVPHPDGDPDDLDAALLALGVTLGSIK
jgi:hypothetical protein